MAHLTAQDQATLAEHFIDIPWCVYLQGFDQVVFCDHEGTVHGAGDRCPTPFDHAGALKCAEHIRASANTAATMPGVFVPEITAFVLHYGIVWAYR